jgi:hypothetical protein
MDLVDEEDGALAPLVLAPLLWCGALSGFVTAADIKPRQIIAEFEVAPDGDFLRVPLTIGSKEHLFLVNTGLVTTTIEQSLQKQLELPKIQVEVRGKRGSKIRDRFGGLAASLHNIPLEFPGGVETADYTTLNEKLDLGCEGEIGMDVLRWYVVQIDFDEGKLRLLSAVPAGAGESLRITPMGAEGGAPLISVTFPGVPAEKFIVHTSRAANSLEICNELFSRLEEKDRLTVLDQDKGVTRSATVAYQAGRLRAVQIGKARHEDLFVNTAEQNAVGLAYLARYVVTFDFPRNKLYWKHGRHFDDRDSRLNLFEVALERDKEAVTLRKVNPYGPARRLGLQPGDILETLNGRDVRRFSNWHIRRVLGREQASLSAVVRRGGERLTLHSEPEDNDENK